MFVTRIRKHERGLLFKHGDFVRLLAPGTHYLWQSLLHPGRLAVETVPILNAKFEHKLLETLVREPSVAAAVTVVDLADNQRALVWKDGRLAFVLGSGRHAFWKTEAKLEVEGFDVSTVRFDHPKIEAIVAHPEAKAHLEWVMVDPNFEVLLLVNGVLRERLAPGKHVFWKGAGNLRVVSVDKREQTLDVAGQEIMTSDKVTLRVNLAVTYQVADALKATLVVTDFSASLYREAQFVLRASVGTRSLDQLLADKEVISGEVRESIAKRAAEFGVEVKSVGLKDIILPGEMKAILNQVIEAEKKAQADNIKRREETASARSQANTARLLAENPMLARIKEMELLQQVLAGADVKFVFGAGDLGEQLRSLVGPKA
jgi:regulator of protease activity HflC (stomatin/prohibitin superfamily)